MDAKFLGTWNLDPTKTTGLEEFAKAMGFSEEKLAMYQKLNYSVTLSQDGDTYKIEVDFKGAAPNTSYTLKIGEEIDYKSLDGYVAKLKLTVEDGKTVETYTYAEKNMSWTVTRTVEDNTMTAVTKMGDTTLTQVLTKA